MVIREIVVFDSFSERISGIFKKLRKSGALKEEDVEAALREIRIALLEADVSLPVAKKFIEDVRGKAIGQNIVKSVSPAQMVTKIVYDHLLELLGTSEEIKISKKPFKILLIGLQGAGKTTTAGKLAKFFTKKGKSVVLASNDTQRPAAIEQLRILSQKVPGAVFAQSEEHKNLNFSEIAELALKTTEEKQADMLIFDTAGRLQIDEIKMEELLETQKIINPDETILVVDIMTGQDVFKVASKFSENLKISGVILTRVDGDARGGVALSLRAITGCPIRFLSTGEQLDDIEFFDPRRIADRLLDMGDIVSLVEKAQENFSQEEAMESMKKLQEGVFTFDDMASQMEKMSKLGGLKGILKILPQSRELEAMMDSQGISDKTVAHQIAIIRSMTKKERANYKLLNGSRKKRIAMGSGTNVQEVNKLIKQYEATIGFMKKFKKMNGLKQLFSGMKK